MRGWRRMEKVEWAGGEMEGRVGGERRLPEDRQSVYQVIGRVRGCWRLLLRQAGKEDETVNWKGLIGEGHIVRERERERSRQGEIAPSARSLPVSHVKSS
jgi:hypothetical protein